MGKIWFLSWFRLRKTEMLKEDRIRQNETCKVQDL